MDIDSWQEWLLLAGLLVFQALLSAAEIAIAAVAARAELRQEVAQSEHRTAKLLLRLAEDSTPLLATVRLGTMLITVVATASAVLILRPPLATWLEGAPLNLSPLSGQIWSFLLIVMGLVGALLLLGDLLPKSLADHHPRPLAFALAWPFQLTIWLLYPLVSSMVGLNNLLVRWLGGGRLTGLPYITEDEIRTLVDASEERGTIELKEKEMITSILEMGRTLVREVMIPRTDIIAFDLQTPLLQALHTILEGGHSRIPIYEETIDNIVGLLYAKDLLPALRDGQVDLPLQELLRPAYFVPESKYVDDLLWELQKQRVHMAIVVDEYGGTAGLATIEDLLEEIVGEIQDEYDTEEPLVQELDQDEFLCDARLSVDDANKLTGLEIPDGDFDTLGGFIYDRLGAIPKVGDRVIVGNFTITVSSIQGLRPVKLHVQRSERDISQTALDQEIKVVSHGH
ncbi:MAG: HlyC/CorC family transporter [Chloroflexia bacterium]|nr:HlyC/CorC family transporter [Chloroflexia bacterium]